MESKSIVLILVGVLLLSIGALNLIGYIQLSLNPVITNPTILYTYPQANTTYRPSEIDELVVYAQDKEYNITIVYYHDTYNVQILLRPTLHQALKHPLTIYSNNLICKFPDIDSDAKVTKADLDAISAHSGAQKGDPNYNSIYDVVPDGIIDIEDVYLASNYCGTAVFAIDFYPAYTPGTSVTFTFIVTNTANFSSDYLGTYQIVDYKYLSGTWYINNVVVSSSSIMFLKEKQIIIKFNCTDRTIPDTAISVKATVNGVTYNLSKSASYYWQSKEIGLKQGANNVKLLAYTTEYRNEITMTIETPELLTFTLGHMLIVIGTLCIISGVMLAVKSRKYEAIY